MKKIEETSKFLSFVLRHSPESIGIKLDSEGWANIGELIAGAEKSRRRLTRELIAEVVATNDKKRFALSPDGQSIRAVQGHSTPSVSIAYVEKTPPEFLYHGTASRFIAAIRQSGLKPGTRHHVHLSQDQKTATIVGSRHGVPVILTIAAQEMQLKGFKFYQADNGVWLTENVPKEYLTE